MTAETERAALGLRRSKWALLQALGRRRRWSATDNKVAEATGYSLQEVRKARRALRAKGLIDYASGTGHTSTLYTVLRRTHPPEAGAEADAVHPLILVDDDQWLTVCESSQDLQLAVEPDFLPDIETGFDALARPLELYAPEDEVMVRVCGSPQPDQLQRHVRSYFSLWTYVKAPELHGDLPEYVASLTALVGTAKTRRKKAKPGS